VNNKRQNAVVESRPYPTGTSFRRLGLCALTTALIAVAGSLLPAGEAQAQRVVQISGANRTATVSVAIGKSSDVRTDASFNDITVGDPEVADVNVLTDRSLSILGKKSGTTRVTVYGEAKKLLGVFDVEVSYDSSMLAAEITRRFAHSGLKVTTVNGKIMLSGTAPDAVTLDQAMTIARQFGPDVINSVAVSSPQQVMLEVRFVEASRKAGRELGVQWNLFSKHTTINTGAQLPAGQLPIGTNGPNIPASAATLSPIVAGGVLSGAAPFGFMVSRLLTGGIEVDALISALEQKGVARSLAEPNLVALSGDTASFLAGGEFPVPVPGTLGQVSIEYKRYGVGLAFTPTVLSGGLINLKIEPEVSQLDTSHPVQVAGISVPPLIVRRASTTVELRDGQSFVIGGLLQNTSTTDQQQLPWLGDVPVLGSLFRSASFQKNETDLAIIVTPRIVRPARPNDPIKTPLDNTLPPNDADLFLMGKPEVARATTRLAAGARLPFSGHILELSKGGALVSVKD
jgi:pilus assembly protein CpaC